MARNHIIVWVGRDRKDHLTPTPCHGVGHLPPDRFLKSALGHFRGGASTDSLGSRLQMGLEDFLTPRDLMSSTPREALWDHGHGCRKCGMGCEGLCGSRR